MKPINVAAPRWLWRYLWAWVQGAIVALWLTLAGLAYYTGFHEAEEISDGLLVSAAELLLQHPKADASAAPLPPRPESANPYGSAYSPSFHVVVWQAGQVVWDSHGAAHQLPLSLTAGHHTLRLNLHGQSQDLRVFVADGLEPARRVAVMLDLQRRDALGADIAEHIVGPALLFLPLVALLLAWAIRRGLLPLQTLSSHIESLDVDAGQTLNTQQQFKELGVTVHAINQLVDRLQAQITRERRFAADVAHELRTPLTSLVLQSRVARETSVSAEQTQALQTVEHDALRAGRILSQLLDLARAESGANDPAESVDLCALAHQAVTEHAPLAYTLGQDIALEAPPLPLCVNGNATLLALALRNLIDNALRHNPPGTYVEVRVGQDAAGHIVLAVSDDGVPAAARQPAPVGGKAPVGAHPQSAPAQTPGQGDRTGPSGVAAGMGIGLTLVERIAQSQSAQWEQGTAAAPFVKRYALMWG